MKFEIRSFAQLSNEELYRVLQLRAEVFVVEQNCVYQDADDLDQGGYHVLGFSQNQEIHAYTRVLPPGSTYSEYASIGRVITSQSFRNQGHGKPLMSFTLAQCQLLYPNHKTKISAQSYLIKFYNGLGFQEIGEEYLEDGIPHIAMVFQA